jgi:hypothetical protein
MNVVSFPFTLLLYKFLTDFIRHIEPLKMDLTDGSETSAKLNLTPWRHPKEHIHDRKDCLRKGLPFLRSAKDEAFGTGDDGARSPLVVAV